MSMPTQDTDPIAERLREIWEQELGVTVESVDDDFFDLGGDSITALAIAGRARREGLEMPRSAVLRRPTLRLLAEAVADPSLFDENDGS